MTKPAILSNDMTGFAAQAWLWRWSEPVTAARLHRW
jgi:hypothetical protein